jgi:tetratricopeptide (TPR) repeat protein
MVIGSRRSQILYLTGLATSLFLALGVSAAADDQIRLKSGNTITGQITGVSDNQILVTIPSATGNPVQSVVYLSDVQSVQMATPAAMAGLKPDATPATVIAALSPLVKEYAGLKTNWVVDAMAQLADAYDNSNQDGQAVAIYAQINQLYPDSPYQNAAAAGLAQLDLQQGKVDDAMAKLQPIIDKASADLAPSPEEGRSYARAFLVYGQALQQQKEYSKALEAYLTVKTMFYQNPALVAQADQLASALRQQNPDLGVD